MGETTGIAWTDHTFNIAHGCMKVSPGCANCYAETLSKRWGRDIWGPAKTTPRKTLSASYWQSPLKWNRAAELAGVRKRVFCSSMCDVFEDHPTIDAEREKLWPLIRATPMLDWQLLTKRPERIAANLPDDWGNGYANVWLGTSIESGAYIERGFHLLHVPAKVHFLSVEPLLESVDLYPLTIEWHGRIGAGTLDWVIVGGESGPGFREMPLHSFEFVVDTAREGGAKVFVKQDSGPKPGRQGRIPDEYWIQEMPN